MLPSTFGLSQRTAIVVRYVFKKIQQDNALAFTVSYTHILKYTSFTFLKLFVFLLVKSELERRGGQFY